MILEQEKKLELLCLLASGLLASGHYTKLDEDDGEPSLKYYKDWIIKDGQDKEILKSSVTEEAFNLLEKFISEIE